MISLNPRFNARVLLLSRGCKQSLQTLAAPLTEAGCNVTLKQWHCFLDLENMNSSLQQADLIVLDMEEQDNEIIDIICRGASKATIVLGTDASPKTKIASFKLGVDDYIVKPFNPAEVALRVVLTLKRHLGDRFNSEDVKEIEVEGMRLNSEKQFVTIYGREISITPVEFKLLWLLVLSRGRVLTKSHTYLFVLGRDYGEFDRTIDMHLSRVRKKLSQVGFQGHKIKTVRGCGYCFG